MSMYEQHFVFGEQVNVYLPHIFIYVYSPLVPLPSSLPSSKPPTSFMMMMRKGKVETDKRMGAIGSHSYRRRIIFICAMLFTLPLNELLLTHTYML